MRLITLKTCTTCLILLFTIGLSGQTTLKGKITDADSNAPLPYATIVVMQSKTGTIANKDGIFEISIADDKLQSDTLEFSQLGYFKSKISVQKYLNLSKSVIILKSNPVVLKDVVVVPKKYTLKKLGIFAKKPYNMKITNVFNHKLGNFIENKEGKQGWIKSASFYIHPLGHPETPFRVRIMDVNKEKGCPGNDLLNENVIVAAKSSGWFKIDLEKYNIIFPKNGAFVVMEWINSGDLYYYKQQMNRKDAKGETEVYTGTFYGQSIGTVIKQPKMVTWGFSLGGEWVPYTMYYKGYPNLMINAEVIFAK